MEREIQDLLPDVLHGTVGTAERGRIATHLAGCASCREELEVLRAVQSAAVFTPAIDAPGIVRKIPPYAIIVPPVERPARSPVVRWLVAAGFALIAVGGGSALLTHGDAVEQEGGMTPIALDNEQGRIGADAAAGSLFIASGLDDLSDDGLAQLISDMGTFDALPANEPEPVFSEDPSAPLDEESF